jgi:hypothetical protein
LGYNGRFRGCGGSRSHSISLGGFRHHGCPQFSDVDGLRSFSVQGRRGHGGRSGERRGDVDGGIFVVFGGSDGYRRSHKSRRSHNFRHGHGYRRNHNFRGSYRFRRSHGHRFSRSGFDYRHGHRCRNCSRFRGNHGCRNCNGSHGRLRGRCGIATTFAGLLGLVRSPSAVFFFLTATDFGVAEHREGTRLADIRHIRAKLATANSCSRCSSRRRGSCATFGRCAAWGVIRTVATTTATAAPTTTTATAITTVLPGTFRCAGIQLVVGFFSVAGFAVGSGS